MFSVSRVKLISGDKGQILSKIFSTNDINISLRFKHGTLSRKPLKKFVPSSRITGEDMIEENTRRFQKVPKISKPQEELVHGVPITSDNSNFLKVKRIYITTTNTYSRVPNITVLKINTTQGDL